MKAYYVCEDCLKVMEEDDPELRAVIGSALTVYFCKKHFKRFLKNHKKEAATKQAIGFAVEEERQN